MAGEEAPPVLVCERPRDGASVSMSARGAVQRGRMFPVGHHDVFAGRRLLRFGQHWQFGTRYSCTSRSTGLTCRNRAGHGWSLGPRDIRTL